MSHHMDVTRGFVMLDSNSVAKSPTTQAKTVTLHGKNVTYSLQVSDADELLIIKTDTQGVTSVVGKFK